MQQPTISSKKKSWHVRLHRPFRAGKNEDKVGKGNSQTAVPNPWEVRKLVVPAVGLLLVGKTR